MPHPQQRPPAPPSDQLRRLPPTALAAQAHVAKRLAPGAAGTRRWLRQFGSDLVGVRYRDDTANQQRLVTVELVVERRPLPPARRGSDWDELLVRLPLGGVTMRRQAMEAGACWDPDLKLWRMHRQQVKALGWLKLVVDP